MTPVWAFTVPFAPGSVAEARAVLTRRLRAQGVAEATVLDAVLVLSEVLSNAVRHARPLPDGGVEVRADVDGGAVVLEVHDGGGPTRPVAARPGSGATSGRGLGIVRSLSESWGVREEGLGSTVWARVTGRRPAGSVDVRDLGASCSAAGPGR